jgi:hypothetical protein
MSRIYGDRHGWSAIDPMVEPGARAAGYIL